MKSRRSWLMGLALGAALFFGTPSANAQFRNSGVPGAFTYQGLIEDGNSPLIGSQTADFTITFYDKPVGGTVLYNETLQAQPVNDGIFNLLIGGPGSPFTGLNFNEQYFMQVTVSSTTIPSTTLPIVPIESAPYALNAGTVNGIEADSLPTAGALFPVPIGTGYTGTAKLDPAFLPSGIPNSLLANGDVETINGIKPDANGDFEIKPGSGITITPGTNSITISTAGGSGAVSSVNTGAGLTETSTGPNGTGAVVVSVGPGAITGSMLGPGVITGQKISGIAGLGLLQDASGLLDVNVDNRTIQITSLANGNMLEVDSIYTGNIATGAVTNVKIANPFITFTSAGNTLTSTVPQPIQLGGTQNYDLNLAHTNTWSVIQNFTNITDVGAITNTGALAETGATTLVGTLAQSGGNVTLAGTAGNTTTIGIVGGANATTINGAFTQLGGAASLNASSNFPTTINTGNSTGNVAIGNNTVGQSNSVTIGSGTLGTIGITGNTSINTTSLGAGLNPTSIGNNANTLTLTGTTNTITGTTNNINGATNIAGALTQTGGNVSMGTTAGNSVTLGNATGTNTVLGITNVNTTGADATNIGNASSSNVIAGTTTINASVNDNTSINTGTSTGTVAIGNAASTTNILGATNINTSGSTNTTIGNAGSTLVILGPETHGANNVSGSNFTITGGTINNTTIGLITPSAADFTSIGLATQGSGAFTTLASSGNSTIGTGAGLTNTFGNGSGTQNTIGSGTNDVNLIGNGASTSNTIGFGDNSSGSVTFANNFLLGRTVAGAAGSGDGNKLIVNGVVSTPPVQASQWELVVNGDAQITGTMEATTIITPPGGTISATTGAFDNLTTFTPANANINMEKGLSFSGGAGLNNISGVGNLTVTGNTTIGGTLGVTGNTSLTTLTTSGGNITDNANLSVTGTTSMTGLLTTNGNIQDNGTLTTTSNITDQGNLSVTGNETVNGTLGVTGNTTLTTLTTSGAITDNSNNLTLGLAGITNYSGTQVVSQGAIPGGTTPPGGYTWTWPDKSGTVAMLSDIANITPPTADGQTLYSTGLGTLVNPYVWNIAPTLNYTGGNGNANSLAFTGTSFTSTSGTNTFGSTNNLQGTTNVTGALLTINTTSVNVSGGTMTSTDVINEGIAGTDQTWMTTSGLATPWAGAGTAPTQPFALNLFEQRVVGDEQVTGTIYSATDLTGITWTPQLRFDNAAPFTTGGTMTFNGGTSPTAASTPVITITGIPAGSYGEQVTATAAAAGGIQVTGAGAGTGLVIDPFATGINVQSTTTGEIIGGGAASPTTGETIVAGTTGETLNMTTANTGTGLAIGGTTTPATGATINAGTTGLSVTAPTSVNATGTANVNVNNTTAGQNGTNINTGTSNGTVAIGNSASTTNMLGLTNVNTGASATNTNIGNSASTTTVNGPTNINITGTALTTVGASTDQIWEQVNGVVTVATTPIVTPGIANNQYDLTVIGDERVTGSINAGAVWSGLRLQRRKRLSSTMQAHTRLAER